jgi:hypothetical protein
MGAFQIVALVPRHCEGEARSNPDVKLPLHNLLDCFTASRLAMTDVVTRNDGRSGSQ